MLLSFSAFYWISGIELLTLSLSQGTIRAFSTQNINGRETLEIIEKYKIETIFIPSILTYQLTEINDFQNYDTSSFKCLITGGTVLNPKQIFKLEEMFKNVQVIICYGLSEAGVVCEFPPDLRLPRNKIQAGTCGLLIGGMALKVTDPDTGAILGPNEKGEICIKTDAMFTGFIKLDSRHFFDSDEFFKTGDIGYYDEDNYIYIGDRLKETFKYKSWRVTPSSIEILFEEHPAVKEAAVFGIPHGEDGHLPTACVVLQDESSSVDLKELEDFINSRVSDHEKVRGGIRIVESIPRTPTGKILRNEILKDFIKSKSDI